MSTNPPPPPSLPEEGNSQPTRQPADYHPPPGYVPYGPRKRKPKRPASGLYLPLWSVIFMLVIVFGIAGSIIFAVLYLGGPASVPGGEPQVIIVTAFITTPTERPLLTPDSSTLSPALTQPAAESLALEGPTLEPTATLTPTPLVIGVGGRVEVVSASGMNIRLAPGTDQAVVTVGNPGDIFTVIDGPQTIDGLTWWQVQVADGRRGWAAENDRTQELLRAIP